MAAINTLRASFSESCRNNSSQNTALRDRVVLVTITHDATGDSIMVPRLPDQQIAAILESYRSDLGQRMPEYVTCGDRSRGFAHLGTTRLCRCRKFWITWHCVQPVIFGHVTLRAGMKIPVWCCLGKKITRYEDESPWSCLILLSRNLFSKNCDSARSPFLVRGVTVHVISRMTV